MSKILVTGGKSGLGLEIVKALNGSHDVFSYDIADGHDVRDVGEKHLYEFFGGMLDVLINCAGINLIGMIEDVEDEQWDTVIDTNAKGIFKMTKACLPMLKTTTGTVLNIISNASHMPMTSSIAYNASKGAAQIMTLQMARELTKRYGITVFGISPNKLAGTDMSRYIESRVPEVRGWTAQQAADYQHASLLAGEETDPAMLADFIAYLLTDKAHHKYLTGCIIPYGA